MRRGYQLLGAFQVGTADTRSKNEKTGSGNGRVDRSARCGTSSGMRLPVVARRSSLAGGSARLTATRRQSGRTSDDRLAAVYTLRTALGSDVRPANQRPTSPTNCRRPARHESAPDGGGRVDLGVGWWKGVRNTNWRLVRSWARRGFDSPPCRRAAAADRQTD